MPRSPIFCLRKKDRNLFLTFGSEVLINKILCIPRNDDNFIRPGDTYELFYWGKDKKWISLGKQKAKGVYLQYKDVPPERTTFPS